MIFSQIRNSVILLLIVLQNQITKIRCETKRSNVRRSTEQIEEKERIALTILANNHEKDLEDLCSALQSLINLPSLQESKAKILIFHEGNLSQSNIDTIQQCVSSSFTIPLQILFPYVNLSSNYPVGFKPDEEWDERFSKWTRFRPLPSRSKWSYAQMIRFWTSQLWHHPAIRDFDIIMRIDTDSCFLADNEYTAVPFSLSKDKGKVYQTNGVDNNHEHGSTLFARSLYDYLKLYTQQHAITPKNPKLYESILNLYQQRHQLPLFQTNFEISRVSFMLRPDVQEFLNALVEIEPYGVFRFRWGDAQTRVMLMALFATEDEIILSSGRGYLHGRGLCQSYISKQ